MTNVNVSTQSAIQQNSSKHLNSVDICRFLACILIMSHHRYLFGENGDYFGAYGYLWVEFFFMLTGYLTMAHFKKYPVAKGNYGKTAVAYTLRKFKDIIPISTIAIIIYYILFAIGYERAGNASKWWTLISEMPLEICMLPSAGFFHANLSPIWYLSAMFLMLPILIYVFLEFEDAWYVLSFLLPILYYGKMGVNSVRAWPNDMVRAFAGMAFGTFIYYIVQKIKSIQWSQFSKLALTIIEVVALAWICLITALNLDFANLLVILMPMQLALMLSGCTYTCLIKGSIFSFLGKISLPLYIVHWVIGLAIQPVTDSMPMRNVLYYSVSVIVAAVILLLQEIVKKKMKKG